MLELRYLLFFIISLHSDLNKYYDGYVVYF